MYNTSPEFDLAIQRSHTIVTKAQVLEANGIFIMDLDINHGNVRVDRRNAIQRTCSIQLTDPTGTLTPQDAEDVLHPLANNRLSLYRGVKFSDGSEELIGIGLFDIFDSRVSDSGEAVVTNINGFDLSKSVSRARLLRNYHVPAGENYDLAIRDLLSFQVPTLSFNIPSIPFLTPPLTFGASGDLGGGDPWKYATEMAKSVGYDIYFDIVGVVNMSPIPDPTVDPVVWDYATGDMSMLLYLEKKLSKEDVFNHVIVTGENTDLEEPIRVEVMDEDPNSPTYIHGPFGNVPTFIQSEFVNSEAQALELANSKLLEVKGMEEELQVITTPNPAHEVGDIVTVSEEVAKASGTYVIEKFNVSLNHNVANNMTLRKVSD